MPRLSVIIPVLNGMPFLPETLASLEAQTYRDFQVLVWDNGSTDGTVAELKRWIPARLPGKLVLDHPLGLGESLRQLVELAGTEYCARIDADDVNLPTRLETQLNYLERHPEVAVVGSQVTKIDAASIDHGHYHQQPLEHNDILHRMLHAWVIWHPTVMFRRQAVIEVGNYRDCQPVEDYDLWLRLAGQYKLANLPECLVKYRVHAASVTMQAQRNDKLTKPLVECFVANAPALFGCTKAEAFKLRSGQNHFLLPLLIRIVKHLCRKQGGTISSRLRSASFQEAFAQLVARKDVITRLVMAGFKPIRGEKQGWAEVVLRRGSRWLLGGILRKARVGTRAPIK